MIQLEAIATASGVVIVFSLTAGLLMVLGSGTPGQSLLVTFSIGILPWFVALTFLPRRRP